MALINLVQTDDSPGCSFNVWCSGRTEGNGPVTNSDCHAGGTVGTTAKSTTLTQGETLVAAVNIISGALGVTTWAGGTHTFRINITSTASNLTLEEIHVCRVNSGCTSVEDLGSLVGLGRNMGTTQVETFSITGVAAATSPASSDKLGYVCIFTNGQMVQPRTFEWTNDQIIDTPIDDGSGRRRISVY